MPGSVGVAPKLSQTVLLCLLQQLGASLGKKETGNDTALELNWIEGVSLKIDCDDAAVKQHLNGVKVQVIKSLEKIAIVAEDPTRVEVIKRMVKGI